MHLMRAFALHWVLSTNLQVTSYGQANSLLTLTGWRWGVGIVRVGGKRSLLLLSRQMGAFFLPRVHISWVSGVLYLCLVPFLKVEDIEANSRNVSSGKPLFLRGCIVGREGRVHTPGQPEVVLLKERPWPWLPYIWSRPSLQLSFKQRRRHPCPTSGLTRLMSTDLTRRKVASLTF